jgi:YesN/AraC family two-component response regulator
LFAFNVRQSEYEIEILLMKIFNDYCRQLSKYLGAELAGGTSEFSYSIKSLREMYAGACSAVELWFVKGKGKLYSRAELEPVAADQQFPNAYEAAQELQQLLNEEKNQALYSTLNELVGGPVCLEQILNTKEILKQFYYGVLNYLRNKGIEEQFASEIRQYEEVLCNEGDLTEWIRWFKNIIEEAQKIQGGSHNAVTRIKAYLQKHYNREITLTDLAREFEMSPYYLSRLFSKSEGIALMEYVANIRIEKAIQYINQGNYKIYEIAQMVGYANVEHFSRVFKKKTGKSPKQFTHSST